MSLNPTDKIKEALARAEDLRARAAKAADPDAEAELRRMGWQWLDIADSYRVVEDSNSFLNGVRARRRAVNERLATTRTSLTAAPAKTDVATRMRTPLPDLLGVLINTAVEFTHGKARAAFYLADETRKTLHHVIGMPEAYAKLVDGFAIGETSLACGLCVATQRPVTTSDVFSEPRWRPWLRLPQEFGYRACWSFPVETASGDALGSFAMYFGEPTEATSSEVEFAAALTRVASRIIQSH